MPLTSADKAFAVIALEKKLFAPAIMAAKEAEVEARLARGEAISLAQHLVETHCLDLVARADLERVRARHGRVCEGCAQTTFLLPGETVAKKPCEHCGGKLKAAAAPGPTARAASAASPSHTAGSGPLAASAPSPRPTSRAAAPPRTPEVVPASPAVRPGPEGSAALDPGTSRPPPEAGPLERRRGTGRAATPPSTATGDAPASPLPGDAAPKTTGEADAERAARLRKLRQAGAFGYEPPPPAPASPPLAAIVVPVAPAPGGGVAAQVTPIAAPEGGAAPPPVARRAVTFAPPPGEGVPGRAPTFAPPEDPAAVAAALAAAKPVVLLDEVADILLYPFRGNGLAILTLGAILAAASGLLGLASLAIRGFVITYLFAYQVKVTNNATVGRREPPDWPDLGELFGLGWRNLLTVLACFLPVIVLWFLQPGVGSGSSGELALSIGPLAHQGGHQVESYIVGKQATDEQLLDLEGRSVRLADRGGRVLVLALLDKDDADDTGTSAGLRKMPRSVGGIGAIFPAFQVHDLDRLARACPDVDVAAVFVDPRLKILRAEGLVPDPTDHEERHHAEPEEPGFERTKPPELNSLPLPGRGQHAVRPEEYAHLKVWRSDDFVLPGIFANPRAIIPTIWILDGAGKVRVQFEGGAYDQALYAAVTSLKRGGDGQARPRPLPGATRGGVGVLAVVWLLLLLLFVFLGFIYYPIAYPMVVIFQNGLVAFRYPAGVRAVVVTARDYLLLLVFWVGISVLTWCISFGVGFLTDVVGEGILLVVGGALVSSWIGFYGSVVTSYAVGRYYAKNQHTLGWFSR